MAIKSFRVFTGYFGFLPVYHNIYYDVPEKTVPRNREIQAAKLKKGNYQFTKPHLNKKRSENYEGTGKNYKD